MRKELYDAIASRLREAVPEVRHVDLWNRNVEFIEQEDNWPRPAVFVEFGPIAWKPFKEGGAYRGAGELTLHIVEDWAEAGDPFALSDRVAGALDGLSGGRFGGLQPTATRTNHDHEEIVESIETFAVRYLRKPR